MKKNLRNILAFAILLVAPLLAAAKNYDIVPAPVEITEGEGKFEIARGAVVGVADKTLLPTDEYLVDYMETYLGIPLAEPQLVKKTKNPAVRLLYIPEYRPAGISAPGIWHPAY